MGFSRTCEYSEPPGRQATDAWRLRHTSGIPGTTPAHTGTTSFAPFGLSCRTRELERILLDNERRSRRIVMGVESIMGLLRRRRVLVPALILISLLLGAGVALSLEK